MKKITNSPMLGGNKWTKLMFRKYWWYVCFIIIGYVLIVVTANSST